MKLSIKLTEGIVLDPKHFWIQNEPKIAALVGNISYLVATGSVLLIKAQPIIDSLGITETVSPYVAIAGKILLGAGLIIKGITKCMGTIDAATGMPVQTTIPSVVSPLTTVK